MKRTSGFFARLAGALAAVSLLQILTIAPGSVPAVFSILAWALPVAQAQSGPSRVCPATSSLDAQGLVSVTDHGATPDDSSDDDVHGIQEAIFDAFERGKAVYFPPGAYHVSDTVRVMLPLRAAVGVTLDLSLDAQGRVLLNGEHSRPGMNQVLYIHPVSGVYQTDRGRTNVLIGARCGTRPMLQLHTWAQGFDDPANPKPVVQYWAQPRDGWASPDIGNTDPALSQPTISFAQVFRGININLNRHAGAVGISHPGAQGSTVEDVKIFATDGYAGAREIPGQGAGTYNMGVFGGQYGIIATTRTKMPLVVGVELVNQTVRAVQWTGNAPLTIVGFQIRRNKSGAPIELAPAGYNQQHTLNLVDGVIEVRRGQTAIENPGQRSLYMQNVHVGRAGIIVNNQASPDLWSSGGNWTRVAEYAFNGAGAEALVNGTRTTGLAASVSETYWERRAPNSLIASHLYPDEIYPALEDTDSTWVQPDGDPDNDREQIQQALDSSTAANVFLAAGTYQVNGTLTLGANDRLFGVSATLSRIVADPSWAAAEGTPLVTTVNDANGNAVLADIGLFQYPLDARLTNLSWRVGADSIVRQVFSALTGWTGVHTSFAHQTYRIEGAGGGKWYGVGGEWGQVNTTSNHPQYRHFAIEGTSQALNIYGMNIERSNSNPQAHLVDASNVRVFGVKGESWDMNGNGVEPTILALSSPQKVQVIGYGGTWNPSLGQALIHVLDLGGTAVSDLTVAGIGPVNHIMENVFDTVRINQPGGFQAIIGDKMGSYVRMD